jgi:hypothetical protein
MAYIVVLLIAAFNCIALFFGSLLAVGGDGSSDGMRLVWYIGYPWIAGFLVIALRQCKRQRRGAAIGTVASTLPAGYILALIGLLVAPLLDMFSPISPHLKEACQKAGPNYMQKPAKVVQSIAYDWPIGTHPPSINYFEIGWRGNIKNQRGGLPQFPPPIQFTENRCCRFEGAPANRVAPFVRHPKAGGHHEIHELTADVLVTYNVSEPAPKAGIQTVDMSVTDRRDGRMLATLRYVMDHQGKRGCGAVADGVMDEQQFIRRATETE